MLKVFSWCCRTVYFYIYNENVTESFFKKNTAFCPSFSPLSLQASSVHSRHLTLCTCSVIVTLNVGTAVKPAQSLSASHTGIERKKRNINKKAIPLMAAHYCWDCTFHHHLRVWFYCGWVLHLLTRSSCTPMLRASDNMMYWLLWKTRRSSNCLLIWFSKQASLGHHVVGICWN